MMNEKEYLTKFMRPFKPIYDEVITKVTEEDPEVFKKRLMIENGGYIFPELNYYMDEDALYDHDEELKSILNQLKRYNYDDLGSGRTSALVPGVIPVDSLLSTNRTNRDRELRLADAFTKMCAELEFVYPRKERVNQIDFMHINHKINLDLNENLRRPKDLSQFIIFPERERQFSSPSGKAIGDY